MTESMKAIRYHEYGDSSKLLVESVSKPIPKANEVLVRVHYSGVNPMDWKLRAGLAKAFFPVAFPSVPGVEFSGVVEETGSGVTSFAKGQRVFGRASGTYAQYVVVPDDSMALVPENLTLEKAASVPMGALTGWHAVEMAKLKSGQTVAVLGAAGGVGAFAVQFARLKGANVIGVVSTLNLGFVRSMGAEAVDYTAGPLSATIPPVDAVIDTVGGASLEEAYSLVKTGGMLVTVAGRPSEEKAKARGITVAALGAGNSSTAPLGQISELLAAGKLAVEVGTVFAFNEAGAAQNLCQEGHGRGRILLKIL
jgi:NADPH:quinone reductase-like Zn-dependent oxidoreductase